MLLKLGLKLFRSFPRGTIVVKVSYHVPGDQDHLKTVDSFQELKQGLNIGVAVIFSFQHQILICDMVLPIAVFLQITLTPVSQFIDRSAEHTSELQSRE